MKPRRRRVTAPAEPPEGFVAVARILGAWGTRGDVKIEPLAPPSVLAPGRTVHLAGRETPIEEVRGSGRILKLRGLDGRETAAEVRGEYLLVPEETLEPLPEGEYYRFQLIGLQVCTTDGRDLGRVSEVLSTRETDVLVVTGEAGENLVPATDEVIREIDLAAGRITIEAVPGLLKD